MDDTKQEQNIYQIIINQDEDEDDFMGGMSIVESHKTTHEINTYIDFTYDYVNQNLLHDASPTVMPRDYVDYICMIIRGIYKSFNASARPDTAEWFKKVMQNSINDERFWSENLTGKTNKE